MWQTEMFNPISSWNSIKIKIKKKYINKEAIAHRVKDKSQKMKANIDSKKKKKLKKEIQRKSENWFHRAENSETYMSIGEEATKSQIIHATEMDQSQALAES